MLVYMYGYRLCFQCFFCEECELWDLVLDTLSESDDSLLLDVATGCGTITFKKQSLRVSVGM